MSAIFLNILDNKRLKILKSLKFTQELKLYLAGGTALALQIGHRTSVDFDFYTPKKFRGGELIVFFKKIFPKNKIEIVRDFDNTFEININQIHLSCFYYPYKLIKKELIIFGVAVTSIEDIAAMKLVAIAQRGKRRDFVDMYYLLKKFGLLKVLKLTKKKYSEFDIYNGLRGLVYFHDADNDHEISRIKIFNKQLSWLKIKKFIKQEVLYFQRNMKNIEL